VLRENPSHDVRFFHPGEPHIEPLVSVREPFVIDAELMKDRGLEVADMHRVFDDVVGKIVGIAVYDTALDAGPPRATP
jgi:hypothetical protein